MIFERYFFSKKKVDFYRFAENITFLKKKIQKSKKLKMRIKKVNFEVKFLVLE